MSDQEWDMDLELDFSSVINRHVALREKLEAQLKAVTEEVKKSHFTITSTVKERDALRLRVTTLEGKTGFCTQCEAYARRVEKLEVALREIAEDEEPGDISYKLAKIAKAALESK